MFTRITSSKLFQRLKKRSYRNLFIAGEVRRTVPFQLRALRAERKWTQADLGKEAAMPQTVISRIENGDAASLNIKTLLKLAAAFDVALVVRFEPIDRLIHWVDNLSPEAMSPRKSETVLADMETEAASPQSRETTWGVSLQVVSGTTVGIVQRNLSFDRPRLVPSNGTTRNARQISTEETGRWQKIAISQ